MPLDSPEESIKNACDDLRSSDWSKQFEACNTLRRACAHHGSSISSGGATLIHALVTESQKLVESLRSSLIKNSILLFIGNSLTQINRLLNRFSKNIEEIYGY